jgi:hypothetical protein
MSKTFSMIASLAKTWSPLFLHKRWLDGRVELASISKEKFVSFLAMNVMERKSLTDGGNICKVFQPKLSNSEFLDVNECYRTSGFVTCPARNPFVYAAFLK